MRHLFSVVAGMRGAGAKSHRDPPSGGCVVVVIRMWQLHIGYDLPFQLSTRSRSADDIQCDLTAVIRLCETLV